MKRIISLFTISTLFLGIVSCDDKLGGEDNFEPTDYTVKGKVEKGPFISGSTINLQPMNAKMAPTGSTFSTTITDNAGNFAFNTATLETPYAQLTANGYFFNEVTGQLSNGTLSLRALVDLSEQSTVNVNILTHLKYARILDLVEKDNKKYKEANKQAQEELLTAFGLQRYTDTDAANYSITAGTPEAAALIAISALILKNRSEAQVTEYLAKLSKEFGENGCFSVETKQTIKNDRNALLKDLKKSEENVKNRYSELGQTITVMPLEYYFDWDDDGTAGNEFLGPDNLPTLSKTEINVPKEGGEYTITVDSEIQLYFESSGLIGDPPLNEITLENFWTLLYDRECGPGAIEKEISGNTIRLVVSKTNSKKQHNTEVPLYDIAGTQAAKITIIQDGDPSLPNPRMGADAESVFLGAFYNMMTTMNYMSKYVNDYGWYSLDGLMKAPLQSNDAIVSSIWSGFYQAINRANTVAYFDRNKEYAFRAPCSLFNSIAYYNMVTLWGGVPYITQPNFDDYNSYNITRASENDLLDTLQVTLESILPELEERKNPYSDGDFIYSSKDVARILLADIHMYRNQYDKAKPYLNEVVATNHYSLASNEDVIMGYITDGFAMQYDNNTIPLFTLSDVLLSLAECDYNLSNNTDAWENARKVADAKGTFVNTTAPEGLLEYISAVRKISMPTVVGRFAFLKRTGLAKTELQIPYDDYLLFPIPENTIKYYPNMEQNPGYDGDRIQQAN